MSEVTTAPATGVSATQAPVGSPPVTTPPAAKTVKAKAIPAPKPVDAPEEPKKFSFKGLKDGDETFDFEGDETAIKNELMKARAANKRFEEAAKERKALNDAWQKTQAELQKVERLRKLVAEDPIRAAEELGVDPGAVEKAFEARLLKQIQKEQATEEQRRAMELEERAIQAEKERDELKRYREEETQKATLTQHKDLIQSAIIKALQTSDLPKNEFMVKRMAQALKASVARGLGLDINYAKEIVMEGLGHDVQSYVGGFAKSILEAHKAGDVSSQIRALESMERALGKDVILALRRADITRLRHSQPKGPGNPLQKPIEMAPPPKVQEGKAYEFDTVEEEREYYRNRAAERQKEWELRRQTQ